jgi:uncharacterized protein
MAKDRNPTNAPVSGGGLEFRPAHYPGRAPIDAYGNGGFRFAGMRHKGSLICLPSGVYAWNVATVDDFDAHAFRQILVEGEQIEILLIGTGEQLSPLPTVLRDLFQNHAIAADAMSTGAAVRTLNILLSEGRAVAAALVAV